MKNEYLTCRRMIHCTGLALVLLLTSALSFAQTQTPSERFDIDGFKIEGNTLLKPDEIEAVLNPFTGTTHQNDYPRNTDPEH